MESYNFYIDRKNAIWNREYYTVKANSKEEALTKVVNGNVDFYDTELLYETEEYLNPEENNGASTVEVYDADGDILLYANSQKLNDDIRSI